MKTILVVDDFATARLYHATLLRSLGHEVETASDGEAALEVLRRRRVDLVLLDLLMPRMGGAELLRRVRAMPGCETLPVVVVSSEGDGVHEASLRDAGAAGRQSPVLLQDVDDVGLGAEEGRGEQAAAKVESGIKSFNGSPADALARVRSEVDALVEMCRRMSAG